MIKEDFVSIEVAQLLKEKGFAEPLVNYYYTAKGERVGYLMPEEQYLCPTHQMAMKWLRMEHNILLTLLPAQENGKLVYLVEVWNWNEKEGIYESTYAPMPRKEPEQAVEAALKYSLENLI